MCGIVLIGEFRLAAVLLTVHCLMHQLGGAAAPTGTRHQQGHRLRDQGLTGAASRAVCVGDAGDSP